MDDFMNDLEAGIPSNPPRHSTKKMKKRKQLDALLKFRSLKSTRLSNEARLTSEDELFLPENKHTSIKLRSSRYQRWCNYTRHILSFCLVCVFMIVCVGLAYANIELKTEVQNLSLRVTDLEKRFSSSEINRVISSLEQIKSRLNVIERWNVSYIYDRLQKLQMDFNQIKRNTLSTETSMNNEEIDVSSKLDKIEEKSTRFSEVTDELDKLSRDADHEAMNIINEKTKPYDRNLIEHLLEQERRDNAHQDTDQLTKNLISLNESLQANTVKWHDELKSLRNEFENYNQTTKIQELAVHFLELTNLVHNSSDKTSVIITTLQSDLNQLKTQIDACKCSQEPVYLKPSIVDTDHLKQDIMTKPNSVNKPLSSSTTIPVVLSKESDQLEKIDHKTVDIAQIINQPPSATN